MIDFDEIFPMFDRTTPRRSGELAGELLVSGICRHPRYRQLNADEDAALLTRVQVIADNIFSDIAETALPKLGFDPRSIEVYRSAAIKAVRDVLPASNGSAMVH
jgi:hypothetical protein